MKKIIFLIVISITYNVTSAQILIKEITYNKETFHSMFKNGEHLVIVTAKKVKEPTRKSINFYTLDKNLSLINENKNIFELKLIPYFSLQSESNKLHDITRISPKYELETPFAHSLDSKHHFFVGEDNTITYFNDKGELNSGNINLESKEQGFYELINIIANNNTAHLIINSSKHGNVNAYRNSVLGSAYEKRPREIVWQMYDDKLSLLSSLQIETEPYSNYSVIKDKLIHWNFEKNNMIKENKIIVNYNTIDKRGVKSSIKIKSSQKSNKKQIKDLKGMKLKIDETNEVIILEYSNEKNTGFVMEFFDLSGKFITSVNKEYPKSKGASNPYLLLNNRMHIYDNDILGVSMYLGQFKQIAYFFNLKNKSFIHSTNEPSPVPLHFDALDYYRLNDLSVTLKRKKDKLKNLPKNNEIIEYESSNFRMNHYNFGQENFLVKYPIPGGMGNRFIFIK